MLADATECKSHLICVRLQGGRTPRLLIALTRATIYLLIYLYIYTHIFFFSPPTQNCRTPINRQRSKVWKENKFDALLRFSSHLRRRLRVHLQKNKQ